jgi:hypothetical protein
MEAVVETIMESWPLQLRLRTDKGQIEVILDERAQIMRAGQPRNPGALRAGQKVDLTIRSGPGGARVVTRVELLD